MGRAYVQRVVGRAASRNTYFLLTRDDYIQAGWVELLRALERYDAEGPVPFTGFVFARLHRTPTDANRYLSPWSRAAERHGQEQAEVVSGDAPLSAGGQSLFDVLVLPDMTNEFLSVEGDPRVRAAVADSLARASQQQALSLLLPLVGVEDEVTGRLLAISPGNVSSARGAAKRRIRRALDALEEA